MIPVSTLCDEYIDRPKLSEQKNPFEYIVRVGVYTRGSEQKMVTQYEVEYQILSMVSTKNFLKNLTLIKAESADSTLKDST